MLKNLYNMERNMLDHDDNHFAQNYLSENMPVCEKKELVLNAKSQFKNQLLPQWLTRKEKF